MAKQSMFYQEKIHYYKNDNSPQINQFHVIPIKIISFCLFLFDGTDSKLLLEEKYHDNIIWESIFWYMFSYNLAMLIQIYKQVLVLGIYPSGTPQAICRCIV